ncbi:hypothetical protein B0T24DRAFT_323503 [Lasiosphaeria ovina]|uniref:Uncharacterized protein n=1 Tax=Lasiosphaeria ovina TaxID=92902 RepID=A0AAE0K7X6_9PEZI|nr:hypothetical protein B0T24DRAFT_323503 [Lasiosphaeria ovina]
MLRKRAMQHCRSHPALVYAMYSSGCMSRTSRCYFERFRKYERWKADLRNSLSPSLPASRVCTGTSRYQVLDQSDAATVWTWTTIPTNSRRNVDPSFGISSPEINIRAGEDNLDLSFTIQSDNQQDQRRPVTKHCQLLILHEPGWRRRLTSAMAYHQMHHSQRKHTYVQELFDGKTLQVPARRLFLLSDRALLSHNLFTTRRPSVTCLNWPTSQCPWQVRISNPLQEYRFTLRARPTARSDGGPLPSPSLPKQSRRMKTRNRLQYSIETGFLESAMFKSREALEIRSFSQDMTAWAWGRGNINHTDSHQAYFPGNRDAQTWRSGEAADGRAIADKTRKPIRSHGRHATS